MRIIDINQSIGILNIEYVGLYNIKDILSMDPKSTVVLQEVISKLQGLIGGGGSTPSGPKEANIP